MTEQTKTQIMDVRTVGVPVTDQDRALDFYTGKLGFEKRMDVPMGEGRWIEVAPPGAAATIALVPSREGAAAGVDTGIRLTTSDADADHAALQAARRRRRSRGPALAWGAADVRVPGPGRQPARDRPAGLTRRARAGCEKMGLGARYGAAREPPGPRASDLGRPQ